MFIFFLCSLHVICSHMKGEEGSTVGTARWTRLLRIKATLSSQRPLHLTQDAFMLFFFHRVFVCFLTIIRGSQRWSEVSWLPRCWTGVQFEKPAGCSTHVSRQSHVICVRQTHTCEAAGNKDQKKKTNSKLDVSDGFISPSIFLLKQETSHLKKS